LHLKNLFIVLFIILFGTFSFPMHEMRRARTVMTLSHGADVLRYGSWLIIHGLVLAFVENSLVGPPSRPIDGGPTSL